MAIYNEPAQWAANPMRFTDANQSTHFIGAYPRQRIYVRCLVVHGGSAVGEMTILDQFGDIIPINGSIYDQSIKSRRDPFQLFFDPSLAVDPKIIDVEVNSYVYGITIEEMPADAEVEVFHGAP